MHYNLRILQYLLIPLHLHSALFRLEFLERKRSFTHHYGKPRDSHDLRGRFTSRRSHTQIPTQEAPF